MLTLFFCATFFFGFKFNFSVALYWTSIWIYYVSFVDFNIQIYLNGISKQNFYFVFNYAECAFIYSLCLYALRHNLKFVIIECFIFYCFLPICNCIVYNLWIIILWLFHHSSMNIFKLYRIMNNIEWLTTILVTNIHIYIANEFINSNYYNIIWTFWWITKFF